MKADKDALRRFVTGELPPEVRGREDTFFQKAVRGNCFPLGLVSIAGALIQAAVLYSLKDLGVMRDPLMRWFALLAVTGLMVFGLFFLRQAKNAMPVPALWACQVVFAVYYTVVDLCILFLSTQMQSAFVTMAPAVLLGASMVMTGGLSIACFGGYFLAMLLTVNGPILLLPGLLAVAAAYALSRERYRRAAEKYFLETRLADGAQEREELSVRLTRLTTWDEQVQMNNRKAVSAWVEAVWPLCVRNRIPVAVLVLSPDGMERVRKEKGSVAAAARLRQFAAALKPFVRRQSDFLGRYEEESFVILYSGPSRQDTGMLLARLREQLQKQCWADDPLATLSLCAGVVYGLPADNMVAAQWMTMAGDALGRARMQGPGTDEIQDI